MEADERLRRLAARSANFGFLLDLEPLLLSYGAAAESHVYDDRTRRWLDNDIRPAASRGLRTALIRRGPWALRQQHDLDAARVPSVRIAPLDELPELIGQLSQGSRWSS